MDDEVTYLIPVQVKKTPDGEWSASDGYALHTGDNEEDVVCWVASLAAKRIIKECRSEE